MTRAIYSISAVDIRRNQIHCDVKCMYMITDVKGSSDMTLLITECILLSPATDAWLWIQRSSWMIIGSLRRYPHTVYTQKIMKHFSKYLLFNKCPCVPSVSLSWQTQFHLCHYAVSHDENEFPDAERFIPERWLRDSPSRSQHHPYSSVPFGVGVRACVGKRVAELEMYFALCRVSMTHVICTFTFTASISLLYVSYI